MNWWPVCCRLIDDFGNNKFKKESAWFGKGTLAYVKFQLNRSINEETMHKKVLDTYTLLIDCNIPAYFVSMAKRRHIKTFYTWKLSARKTVFVCVTNRVPKLYDILFQTDWIIAFWCSFLLWNASKPLFVFLHDM